MLEITFPSILFTIINIFVLLGGLTFFLFKPVNKILAERQAEADAGQAEIEKKKAEADAIKAQYEESMKDVDATKAAIVSEAKAKASVEFDRIVTEANDKAKEILATAKKEAKQEKAKMIESANDEIKDMVTEATAKVLAAKADAAADRALYDQFIQKSGN